MARYTHFLHHLLTFVFTLIINNPFMSINGDQNPTLPNILPYHQLLSQNISSKILIQKSSVEFASYDFGNLIHKSPSAVFFPSSVQDIASLIHLSYNHSMPFNVAARGRGHSCRGQAMVENGVVINMPSLGTSTMGKIDNYDHYNINIYNNNNYNNNRIRVFYDGSLGFYYADVGGEQLWIDVLKATLEYGVFPLSWTDYLYLSVGGTLSNAGISGQAFRYGPQISNVLELDVVTGKGELITCSKKINSELFYAVLGGLGQFGIITRARIKLEAAPKKVKWVRMLYDNFTTFTRDQEHLISLYGNYQELMGLNNGLNYVEGSLIMHQVDPNNWRSSFFTPNDQARIASLDPPNGILFFLEVAKYNYYDSSDVNDDDKFNKEVEKEIEGLNFIEGCIFTKEVKLVDFLNRVRKGEEDLESKGMWDVPHPWLNMFIPRSQIQDLYNALTNIIANHTKDFAGPVLIYPLNRNKWDDNMSAVIPEEDVFYTLGLLHSRGKNDWQIFERKNEELLKYCEENGINIKQYLPYYTTKEDWKNHFGKKWKIFEQRKRLFDPKMILSPGQNIFQGQGLIIEEDIPI